MCEQTYLLLKFNDEILPKFKHKIAREKGAKAPFIKNNAHLLIT